MKTFRVLFPFCGLGAGALGFLRAAATLFDVEHRFVSMGGIDFDKHACRDFERLTKSPALCADVAKLTVEELIAFFGPDAPDVVFLSPPCKASSGLMSPEKAKSAKYEAMNRLMLDWTRLMFAAWATPPKLVLLENVPGITKRAEKHLAEVKRLLRAHGYALHASSHDCGEIGGLAQHRKRFLLVARHAASTPALLYQPIKRRVRAIGEVLETLPLPGDPSAGPLHRLRSISMLNWLRLSMIRPGKDWKDLEGAIAMHERRTPFNNVLVMRGWTEPAGAITSGTTPTAGGQSVADVRVGNAYPHTYGVVRWDCPSHTITGNTHTPGGGPFSVADPRIPIRGHNGTYGVGSWSEPSGVVAGASRVSNGTYAVGDTRIDARPHRGVYGVRPWTESSGAVCGENAPSNGAFSIADVRLGCEPYNGTYGVLDYGRPAGTITASMQIDNGAAAVADPRIPGSPALRVAFFPRDLLSSPPFAPVLPTEDGTWHRPLTLLELAALQGLPTVVDGKPLELSGRSSSRWAEAIGNAVPVPTAEAIARQMLITLANASAGAFALSGEGGDVWVRRREEVRDGR